MKSAASMAALRRCLTTRKKRSERSKGSISARQKAMNCGSVTRPVASRSCALSPEGGDGCSS